jgi:hypothetical protein
MSATDLRALYYTTPCPALINADVDRIYKHIIVTATSGKLWADFDIHIGRSIKVIQRLESLFSDVHMIELETRVHKRLYRALWVHTQKNTDEPQRPVLPDLR